MNVLPALIHHLQQHYPHQWTQTRPTHTHNNHPTIQTITHHNQTTTHIEITQKDTTLEIEHTQYTTSTTYTKKHATISLLDPDFLDKVHQIIDSTP